jgi:hypothetical protein
LKKIGIANKKAIYHILIFLLLIIYLLSANFLFDRFFTVDRESIIKNIDVPNSTQDIQYSFDIIKNDKSGWKELLTIQGWAFIEYQNAKNSSIYLVLDNKTTRYVLTTSSMNRPDLTKFLHPESNLNNSGFEANIPKVLIDDKNYQLGIIIENQNVQKYTSTNYYCTKGYCSKI